MEHTPSKPARDWISRCSDRLQKQWRTIDPTRLDDLAMDLARDERLRAMEPEVAAVEWLRQGIPNAS
jgi:hypothetical protein